MCARPPQRVRDAGILLYTVGLGGDVNATLLREIATQPDYYFQSPTPADLAAIYARLAGDLREVPAANLLITDVVAPEFEIVPGSFTGAATPQVSGDTLRWYLPRLPQGVTEVSFSVRPKQCGTFDVNRSASVDYEDNRGHAADADLPRAERSRGGLRARRDRCLHPRQRPGLRHDPQQRAVVGKPRHLGAPCRRRRHDSTRTPRPGRRNTIYARVWNRGTTTVTDIDVSFYFANPGPGADLAGRLARAGATQRIASLAPGQSAVVSIPWDVPALAGHWCLLVRISAATRSRSATTACRGRTTSPSATCTSSTTPAAARRLPVG